jgi:hypothetical protein
MKMNIKNYLITILIIYCFLIEYSVSDIPSHCLSSQIMGDWIFYHTEPVPKTLNELYNHKCGLKDHTDKYHINDFNIDLNSFKSSFEIRFYKDHSSEIIRNSNGFDIQNVNLLYIKIKNYLF